MEGLNIDTNNYYKFATTVSMVACIYFLSFYYFFQSPYNIQASKNNIEAAKLESQRGYLRGLQVELFENIRPYVKGSGMIYTFATKHAGADTFEYYLNRANDSIIKIRVDSLNILTAHLAEISFKKRAIDEATIVFEKSIRVQRVIFYCLGGLFLILFVFYLSRWHKFKHVIDK